MIPAITKIYSLYSTVPQVRCWFVFKTTNYCCRVQMCPGKNVVLAKKDSKKFVFSTKSLEKISFFLFFFFFFLFLLPKCYNVSSVCLVYSVKGLNSSLSSRS